MKFFAPSLILACALSLSEAGVLGAIGAQEGDDTPKSILKTILTKDGALGDIGTDSRQFGQFRLDFVVDAIVDAGD